MDYGSSVYSEVSKRRGRPQVKVWEDYMQRPCPIGSVIHHIDENKVNNDISNLICLTRKEHTRIHHLGNTNRLGHKHTEETKRKISESSKGNTHGFSIGNIPWSKGKKIKPWSKETREKMKGRLNKKIKCVETDIIYQSALQASSVTGITTVKAAACGIQKTAGGYHWEYV